MSNEEIKNDFLKDIKTDDEWFERISKFHNETLTDFTISSQSIERDFKCVAMGTCGKQTNIYKNFLYLIEHNYMKSILLQSMVVQFQLTKTKFSNELIKYAMNPI